MQNACYKNIYKYTDTLYIQELFTFMSVGEWLPSCHSLESRDGEKDQSPMNGGAGLGWSTSHPTTAPPPFALRIPHHSHHNSTKQLSHIDYPLSYTLPTFHWTLPVSSQLSPLSAMSTINEQKSIESDQKQQLHSKPGSLGEKLSVLGYRRRARPFSRPPNGCSRRRTASSRNRMTHAQEHAQRADAAKMAAPLEGAEGEKTSCATP